MAKFIIKKDGTREPFNAEKIKRGVIAAASDAGMSEEEVIKLASQVSSAVEKAFMDMDEVSAFDVREKTLSELDSSSPTVAESWREYEITK